MNPESRSLETLAIHAAQDVDTTTGAVMPSIVVSSTFARPHPEQPRAFAYARSNNPTRQTLEQCLAALEGARHGLAFASGCAAVSTLLQMLEPGQRLIASPDLYGGTYRILEQVMAPKGLEIRWVDLCDLEALDAALAEGPCAYVWVETPTNPLLRLVDLRALSEKAHRHGAKVVLDNTFATPVLQRPFELGVDLVLHSTTKYLNGHSDMIGGAILTCDDALAQKLRFLQNALGAVPSPFDCFLLLRGIKTLCVRMERHCQTALRLAEWLEARPEVETLYYPGLPSHPQHALAKRQMKGFGGMISLRLKGGWRAAESVLSRLRLFALAESLGGVESLVCHPAKMTHAALPAELKARLGIDEGLIRFSVGLESFDDLRADLERALGEESS